MPVKYTEWNFDTLILANETASMNVDKSMVSLMRAAMLQILNECGINGDVEQVRDHWGNFWRVRIDQPKDRFIYDLHGGDREFMTRYMLRYEQLMRERNEVRSARI